MIKSGIGLICLLMVVGCGKENIPSTEESQILENHRLPQPMKKEIETQSRETQEPKGPDTISSTSVKEDHNHPPKKGEWILKRETNELGAEVGPIQIESTTGFLSEDEKRVIKIQIRLSGEIVFQVERPDGGEGLSFHDDKRLELEYGVNRVTVDVLSQKGVLKSSKGSIISNRQIILPKNQQANLLLKRCFLSNEPVSIGIKHKNSIEIGLFKNIDLNDYKQKADELRKILQR